jgi:serine/threonine protein kinase
MTRTARPRRQQEWDFLLALCHPAVLPCLRAFEVPSPAHTRRVVCMITPLCDTDLGAAIEACWANTAFRGVISASERLALAAQLCDWLMHERHVAHRDIKPGNVLVARRAVLSKDIDPRVASAHHTAAGTVAYAVRRARARSSVLRGASLRVCADKLQRTMGRMRVATGTRGVSRTSVLLPRGRVVARAGAG